MQPSYTTIAELFSQEQRFTVPLFQRPYVWSKDEQWDPLWEDILGVLQRLQNRSSDEPIAVHFLGTVVLEQRLTSTGSLMRREIIDGQQRLTTLQILLHAVQHSISSLALKEMEEANRKALNFEEQRLIRLTKNVSPGEEEYKVWPTNEDRAPFRSVMDSSIENGPSTESRMAEAYDFFRMSADKYIDENGKIDAAKRLAAALRDFLKLIVLDLDKQDEPQAIFETLNAHGTPLLPTDLTKNWLLWEAARAGLDEPKLYENYWQHFDRESHYWRENVGTGHTARARVDAFLQHWLVKETAQAIPPRHVYDRFLKHAANVKAASSSNAIPVAERLMNDICTDSRHFERIDKPFGKTRFDIFLDRLRALDIVVFHPVLLKAMDRFSGHSETLDGLGQILESYLVRRMICGFQTRSYGTLALKLLNVLNHSDSQNSVEQVRTELLSFRGTDQWPDDEEFRNSWMTRRFYGYFRRSRVAMILKALEHRHQASNQKAEPIIAFDWDRLEVEHIMPQKWETHWPLPDGVSQDRRTTYVQNIGNLTLVSKRLNSSLSNAPWSKSNGEPGKREHLKEHSLLQLNSRLLDLYWGSWTEESIDSRAAAMFDEALVIWPK